MKNAVWVFVGAVCVWFGNCSGTCIREELHYADCAPFIHVASFKDGERVVQVCRTLDGGLEMKPGR